MNAGGQADKDKQEQGFFYREELGRLAYRPPEAPETEGEEAEGEAEDSFSLRYLERYRYFDLAAIVASAAVTRTAWKEAQAQLKAGRAFLTALDLEEILLGQRMEKRLQIHFAGANRYEEGRLTLAPSQVESGFCPICLRFWRGGQQRGFCAHMAAALYLGVVRLARRPEIDGTDKAARQLLRRSSHAAAEARPGSVRLVPTLVMEKTSLYASFRIGTERLYKIKNIGRVLHAIENGDSLRFGKTELALSWSALDSHAKRLAALWQDVNNEQEALLSGRSSLAGSILTPGELLQTNRLPLYGHRLDAFCGLEKEKELEAEGLGGKGEEPGSILLTLEEALPPVTATIGKLLGEDGSFQGIAVSGRLPQLWRGTEKDYFLKGRALCTASKKAVDALYPLRSIAQDESFFFRVGVHHLALFYNKTLPWLEDLAAVSQPDAAEIRRYQPPACALSFRLDREEGGRLVCAAEAAYGARSFSLAREGAVVAWRDAVLEEEAKACLQRYFPAVDAEKAIFFVDPQEDEERAFSLLETGVEELLRLGEVFTTPRFLSLRVRRPQLAVGVSLNSGLLELSIAGQELAAEEIEALLAAYREKRRYVRLKNGDFLSAQGEDVAQLSQMAGDMGVPIRDFVRGKMHLPAYRALYIDHMLEAGEALSEERGASFKKLVREFKTVPDQDFPLPQTLGVKPRRYQRVAYRWLRILQKYGFGGILADEMGLGKTLETTLLLEANREAGVPGPALVVAPSSLVYNWGEELVRYAPALKVGVAAGAREERLALLQKANRCDVLVTSYDALKRDIASYEGLSFSVQVLDEAQTIKNASSQAAKCVKLVRASTRFALTGTPIENRLSELWSIFDYLMPGFLHTYAEFRARFETPIVKYGDEAAMERLRAMVSPFLLRRLKRDVLRDLPEKLEEVRFAHMEDGQARLYRAHAQALSRELREGSQADFNQNRMRILAEILCLRQLCCDPALLFENYEGGSAKLDACMDLVQSAVEAGHKVLLFSQFTSMLALLEKRLAGGGLPYYLITGATPAEERLALVKCFNQDTTPVFLISLKAGGTGLNLTGADVVIHYDPWWNQAVQNQATDRAHRLGQRRVVTVFKLICKDTIEEKILALQEKKNALSEELLSGEAVSSGELSREALLQLLD